MTARSAVPGATRTAGLAGAGWRRLRLVLLLSALSSFGAMSIDMYLPGLPRLAAEFGAGGAGAQLTVSSFLLGFGFGQLLYGPLADRLGRRRPLMVGLGLYCVASIGCALAPSLEALVLLRFLQALGGCAGPILVRAAIRDLHGRVEGARMLSLITAVMALAPLLAPLLGGQLVVHLGWRAVFWLLTVTGSLCLAGALAFFAESLPPERRLAGSWGSLPVRYAGMLRDRHFLGYALSGAMVLGGMFAYITASPALFIGRYGVPAQYYGLIFGANAAGIMLCAAINRRLLGRFGVDRMLRVGMLLAAGSGLVLAVAAVTGWGGFAGILVPLFCFVASIGFVSANSIAGALDLFPHQAGMAAALIGTTQFGVGAGLSGLVALLDDGTALPMCGVIGAAGIAALGVFVASQRRRLPA